MKQLTDHLYQISLGPVNAFVVEDQGLTLVDTGLPGSADKILAAIRKGGKNPDDIQRIILTHWHPDHAGSAAELKRRTKARLYAHALDAPLLEQGDGSSRPQHLTPGLLNWLVFQLFIKRTSSLIPAVQVDERLADNDVLPIAGGLRVIHTPGHSAGHIALLLEQEGVLIAGDLCANLPSLGYSTVYENRALGRQSILKAAAFPFDKAVFGHGNLLQPAASQKMQAKFREEVAG